MSLPDPPTTDGVGSPSVVYGVIYVVTNTVNGKQYVGQTTKTAEQRWKGHTSKSSNCRALWNAIQKYRVESFTLGVVGTGSDKQDLDAKESEWVAKLGTMAPNGYNLTTGGDSGGSWSQETNELRRKALLGRVLPQKTRDLIRAAKSGKPLTQEHKDALRVPKKNRSPEGMSARAAAVRKTYANMTPEDRCKLGQHRVGVPHTEESIAKMRAKAQARVARKRESLATS